VRSYRTLLCFCYTAVCALAKHEKWSDITFDIEVDGEEERIAQVHVSKATKKGQARFVQAQTGANRALKEWRKISPHNAETDLVWFGQNLDAAGKPTKVTDLNKSFQSYLRNIQFDGRKDGLLKDRDGDRRSLYSLRHTYATLRLEKGDVSIYDLSMNMGCKVKQIETHYSHVVSKNRRQQITKTNRGKNRAVDAGQGADMPNEVFTAEILRKFKAGELTDEMFLALAKSGK
jgi:integrase